MVPRSSCAHTARGAGASNHRRGLLTGWPSRKDFGLQQSPTPFPAEFQPIHSRAALAEGRTPAVGSYPPRSPAAGTHSSQEVCDA